MARVFRPFRARASSTNFPGRCPGLSHCVPVGTRIRPMRRNRAVPGPGSAEIHIARRGGPRLFIEHQGIDLFDLNRLIVGLRF